MNKNYNFNTAIVFSCSICNLNCVYCNIDKNPALKELDDILEDSFKGDYYFNRIKKYFNKDGLRTLETWGGEPLLKIERIFPLIDSLVKYYPNFQTFFSSTNFSFANWPEKVMSLVECFEKYPLRRFHVQLQLSIDGPEYLNDLGRGNGTTQLCLNNYRRLLDLLKEHDSKNVKLSLHCKQTLSSDAIDQLQTLDSVKEYYEFFDKEFLKPFEEKQLTWVEFTPSEPNTAVPSPITVKDGKKFAKLVKLCQDLKEYNEINNISLFGNKFVPFKCHSGACKLTNTYKEGPAGCGSGAMNGNISFLPANMLCICHLGFGEFVDKYKIYQTKSAKDNDEHKVISFDKFIEETRFKSCLTEDQYDLFMDYVEAMSNQDSTNRMAHMVETIIALGEANLINPKYANRENALQGARYIANSCPFCINDAINMNGTMGFQQIAMYKEILNGVDDLVKEGD